MTAGLRERKKRHTREHISDAATTLFMRQGFERTTIAEIADAADVAKMTVTNYFPRKEDLAFDRHLEIERMLADAVAQRSHDVGAIRAVSNAYQTALTAREPILGFMGVAFAELVVGSPALAAREREIQARQEAALVDALVAEFASSPADIRPRVVGMQLAGLVRVLYHEGRRRLLLDESTDTIVRALRRVAREGFATVEAGAPPAYTRADRPGAPIRAAAGAGRR